jgi:hypothetical protein
MILADYQTGKMKKLGQNMETHIDFEYHRVREECKMSEMCEKQI